MAADGLKRLESGRYRDDESGSIASLGMTHHTQAQSCDRGSADTLFSGTGIDCTCRSHALFEPENRQVSEEARWS